MTFARDTKWVRLGWLPLFICAASCVRASYGPDRCDTASDCAYLGRPARCELNHRCSRLDASCSSGWRYGAYSGGECVQTQDAGADSADTDLPPPPEVGPDQSPPDCGEAAQPCCGSSCDAGLGCVGGVCRCLAAIKIDEYFSCAREASGALFCWGDNTYGQLGIGVLGGVHDAPTAVLGLNAAGVDLGAYHTCARAPSGAAWCWGRNEDAQVVAPASTSLYPAPEPIALTGVAQLAAGGFHSCARKTDQSVWCWGRNQDGQIGDGTTGAPLGLTPVSDALGTGPVTDVAAGGFHSCVVVAGGLWCWGRNVEGQIGNGSVGGSVPTPLQVLQDVEQVAAGDWHSCALKTDGTIWCWGKNNSGQLGSGAAGSPVPTPARVSGPTSQSFVSVVAGDDHSCAIDATGSLWCWGRNNHGQIGDGSSSNDRTTPTRVGSLSGVRQVALGRHHSCALVEPDQIYCWGSNIHGELGLGSGPDVSTPQPVQLSCP